MKNLENYDAKDKRNFKFLIGFPFGIMMLMISYIFVYLCDGKETYIIEVSRLTDIKVFISQVLRAGIIYMIFSICLQGIYKNMCNINSKLTYKNLITYICYFVIMILGVVLLSSNFEKTEVFDSLIGLGTILIVIICIIYCTKISIMEKSINKKIKERNKDN